MRMSFTHCKNCTIQYFLLKSPAFEVRKNVLIISTSQYTCPIIHKIDFQWTFATWRNMYVRSCECAVTSVVYDSSKIPWTVVCQASLPMGFSRQEHWSGFPCPPPGDLPNPGIKLKSPILQGDSLLSEPPGTPKNTGVGNLTLFQGIFLSQESN